MQLGSDAYLMRGHAVQNQGEFDNQRCEDDQQQDAEHAEKKIIRNMTTMMGLKR